MIAITVDDERPMLTALTKITQKIFRPSKCKELLILIKYIYLHEKC